ncbi:MAG: Fur family transcriptional regulator [Actinomycetota bacterium]
MTAGRAKAAGVRSTRQRAAIVDTLRRASGFKTPQELHLDLIESGARVGLATVYRNLQALAEIGGVDVLHTGDGDAMYRLCEVDDHHHHLVCRACGVSVEVVAAEVERWADRIGRRHGFADVTHTVEIFGVCAACSP